MALELLLEEEETQINGIIMIADFRNFGLTQAKHMKPTLFRTYSKVFWSCYPIRVKGIHIIDQPAIFSVIWPIVSYFMKEKVKKRVFLHGSDIDSFLSHFDVNIIPENFGGQQQPMVMNAWVTALMGAETRLPHLWSE